MAVTPNYGWPIPVATDYVKDGWDAIADLGNAIDSTVAGLGTAGFTLITSNTFTTAGSVQINNCFSSTYKSYKAILKLTAASANTGVYLQLSSSGTAATGANYSEGGYVIRYTGSSILASANNTTGTTLTNVTGSNPNATGATIDFISPYESAVTVLLSQSTGIDGTSSFGGFRNGIHNVATSYDGMKIILDSGTISGNIKIYGYKD